MAEPQFATEAQKRELCDEMLQDYLEGQNALHVKLQSHASVNNATQGQPLMVPFQELDLHIEPVDREALLNRVMREPTHQAIVRTTTALLCCSRQPWDRQLTELEQKMIVEAQPRVLLHFRCFWPPSGDEWSEFYDEYGAYLLQGTENKAHLKLALEQQWPLEIGFATYGGEMVRFVVLPPFAADQCGARIKINKS